MESKAKLFGHPIHQMLVVIPLGLMVMACIFDCIALASGDRTFFAVSYWNIYAGIIGGLIAAVFGLWDWLAIPNGTRAKSIGAWHGIGNVVMVGLFTGSCLIRYFAAAHIPTTSALVLSFCGLVVGSVTGWLGGELVDRLGVGVDEG